MHPFYRLKERLQQEGWYIGWALPCCQTCAWQELPYEHEEGPFKGETLDWTKLLFSHEQDCMVDYEYDETNDVRIFPDGKTEDDYDCVTFPHYKPEETSGSLFCFNGDDEGIKNLINIIPLIEECGCKIQWNKSGDSRPYINWN